LSVSAFGNVVYPPVMAELTIDGISRSFSDFKLNPSHFDIIAGCVERESEVVRISLRGTHLEFRIFQAGQGSYFCLYSCAPAGCSPTERWPRETGTEFNVLLFRFGHWLRHEVIPYGASLGYRSSDLSANAAAR
jgi:hypothetical protein